MRKGKVLKKLFLWLGIALIAVIGYCAWRFGPVLMAAYREGFFDNPEMRKYEGTSRDNLKALHTALMLYHDSEGQFPDAAAWMDAIKNRVKVADMAEAEAMKKFVNPMVRPGGAGSFGYAMNDAASKKYKDDLKDKGKTILIFDSRETGWNAHGDPKALMPSPPRPGGNLAITVDGTIVKLK